MTLVQTNQSPTYGRRQFEREMLAEKPVLTRLSRTLTGHRERAEDLVQDTFMKALLGWESYVPNTNMRAWLCMILRNQFYSEKRRDWRSSPLDQEVAERTIVDLAINQEEQLGFNQEFAFYAPLLGLIPLDMRDSIIAVHYLGMKYEETAQLFECEVGTIKSRVSRGLSALQTIIASGERYALDYSPWEHASQDVPRNHPYYPVAKAYEEIGVFLRSQDKDRAIHNTKPAAKSRLDSLWLELLESGELDSEESLDSLMRA